MTGSAAAQTVSVTSEPAGARVEIDGVHVGATPLVRSVEAGTRTVNVRRPGFAVWQRDVEVASGDTARVDATLDQLLGTLVFEGLPDGATVTVDGVPVELPARVGAGVPTVVVRVPGQPDARRTAPVGDGRVTTVLYSPVRFEPVRFASALAAPGVVQLYEGRRLVGAGVVVGLASTLGVAVAADMEMQQEREGARQAELRYTSASSEPAVRRALDEVERHRARAQEIQGRRTAAYVGLTAVYLLGAVDAVLHHAFRPSLSSTAPAFPGVSAQVGGDGFSLAFRL